MSQNAARKIAVDLDRAVVEKAIELTPTGGNAKPFLWQWVEGELHVSHDEKLAKHYLNPSNHASWISMGCLLTSVEVAANAQGWSTEANVMDDLKAAIRFVPSSGANHAISMRTLEQRVTVRTAFKSSSPPALPGVAFHGTKAHLQAAEDLKPSFISYLRSADKYLWYQRKALDSFFNEIRFFENEKSPRGIRSKDLGINKMDEFMIYLFSFVPWLLFLIARIPVLNHTFVAAAKRSIKNSHFFLVTAQSLDSQSLLRAGQTAMWNWLSVVEQGYHAQPFTVASLSVATNALGRLPEDTQARFRKLFADVAPEVFQKQFDLAKDEHPVWMLRVGKN